MKTDEFRAWLKARQWNGNPLTPAGISSRLSKAKRFERAMPALGLGHADLDAEFDRDGMEHVTRVLRQWCQTAAQEGHAPAELVGDPRNPSARINNVAAAVRTYRQFRGAEAQPASDWPALDELRTAFLDRVPDFERFTQTDNGYERIERAYKDAIIAQVREIVASEDDDEQAGRRIYRALIPNQGPLLRWQTDDDFSRNFPELAPDFYGVIGRLARDPRPITDAIMAAADAFGRLRSAGAATLTVGQVAAIAITVAGVVRPNDAAPFKMTKARELATLLTGEPIFRGSVLVREQLEQWLDLLRRVEWVMRERWNWEPRDLIDVQGFAWAALDEDWAAEEETDLDDSAIWFVTARNGAADGLDHYVSRGEWHLLDDRNGRANQLVREMQPGDRIVMRDFFGQKHNLPFDAGGRRVTALRVRATGVVTEQRGDGVSVGVDWTVLPEPRTWFLYTNNDPVWRLRTDSEAAQKLAAFVFDDEPQDYEWFAERWFTDEADENMEPVTVQPNPTNLILYGPPGTGKTFATAEHAVRLCGEEPPADRTALMARYHALEAQQRIRFVTFHQSYAYEDFVEGLRPTTGAEGEQASGGFHLEARPGVFREIAALAEQAAKAAQAGGVPFAVGKRQVFKMSLGRAGVEDHIFDAAIEGGHVVLGWGGEVDWTPYDSYDAIHARWNQDHPGTSGNDGNIAQVARFRADMKIGDLVVVSYGNTRFRAIGEVTGDYEYAPGEDGNYNHRRKVKWLYQPDEPLPVSFYNKPFTMRSCYLLREEHLNREALALLLPGSGGGAPVAPKSFLLICDEINRANISKVFGELITLLEADKRLGAENEIRVRLPYSGDLFGVPANLHVIGTMNTADRLIALIDKALRRRFTFTEMMPLPDLPELAEAGEGAGVDLPALLRTINDGIEYLLDREHQIGHAWFLNCTSRDALDATMREKIIPLIAEYFFEDWGKVADVLGGREDNPFLERIVLKAPPGYRDEEPRYRWRVRDGFAADAYARAIGG